MGDRRGAEEKLAQYIREKHTGGIAQGSKDPAHIPVADVINLYLKDIAPQRSRPHEIASRLAYVLDFFGTANLDTVNGARCRAYVAQRSTKAAARRELEDFRSAINHHRAEGLHDRIVTVTLPDRSPRRERWLTKGEAARLILAAWRYREKQGGPMAGRRTRRHVAKFMVVARYMGSRAGVICSASIETKRPPGRSWIDLTTGILYGRPAGERETNKKKQTVQVPAKLLAHMRRWRAAGQRYVVEWNGEPVSSVTKAHRAVCIDAGMDDVTPHIWRHSVATWLLADGLPREDVAEWLAMSEEVLKRTYSHVQPGSLDNVRRAL